MKRIMSMLVACSAMLFSVTAFEQNGFADSVETSGVLNASGGVRFPDGIVQSSACGACAELLPIERGGTGGDTASEARANLGVPAIVLPNTFTLGPQTLLSGGAGLNALIVQGAVGQSANLQEWRDSGGTALVSVGSGGDINLPATAVVRSGGALFIHNNSNGGFFAGKNTGNQTMSGCCNTASGELAFDANITGHNNTASGYLALSSNTTGNYNIAIGRAALVLNTEGEGNSAIGYYSISNNISGNYNTALGFQSLYNTTSSHSTAIGANTLFSNTEGGFNTAIGSNSLNANSKGSYNTASGYQALKGNTTANNNTAMGARALLTQSYSNSDTAWESHNTAVGFDALYTNQPTSTTNGHHNTAVGSEALRQNTTGNYNTAVGRHALYDNTTGLYHTAVGAYALDNNTDGQHNTALGVDAGFTNVNGDNNTYIGYLADASENNFSNATAIGYNAIVTASNMVRIGNASVTIIEGKVPFTSPSDIRLKEDVREITRGLDFIKALRPVQFRMKSGNERIDFGFIAQDIEALLGTDYNVLGIGGDADRTLSLRYTDFIAPMVKAIQEQQGMIEQLKAEVAELKRMLGK
jgi:hypothetical protein